MSGSGKGVVSPGKLLNSKWTAVSPQHRQRHFIVVEVDYDEDGRVVMCVIEAVIDKQQFAIDWRDLSKQETWRPGWLR